MRARNIKVHIEELVLHGFEPGDRHDIAAAVERELSQLLAQNFTEHVAHDWLRNDLAQASVDAGSFHVAANSRPNSIGSQIALALLGGITK
jgi:hypothetical protein